VCLALNHKESEMAKSSPRKIANERGLLLPLVSAQDCEAPFIAIIAVMQNMHRSSDTIAATSSGEARSAFKVFSSDGC
jgi:hypothetical protein